jgi:hypothetical protein
MVWSFGKNEGNPDSKDSAEAHTIWTTKWRTTISEMAQLQLSALEPEQTEGSNPWRWWWWWWWWCETSLVVEAEGRAEECWIPVPTIRASYLESCLPRCHSVCPAASRSHEQAFYWLLRKHRHGIPSLLMISFKTWINLLNLLVLVLAIADVCHRTQYFEQVVERSEGTNISIHTHRQTFRSDPSPSPTLIRLPR